MPAIRPGYLAETPITEFGLGKSSSRNLRALYPTHPLFGEMNDAAIRNSFFTPPETTGERGNRVMSDGGYMFGQVDLDYQGTPNFADVPVGGGGLPASPYGPNIASPTDGHNPASIPAEGVIATLETAQVSAGEEQPGSRGAFVGNSLISPHRTKFVAGPPGEDLPAGNGSGNTFIVRVF